jgi:MtrB/PioB family decaheme-associated outer membrane protein
MKTKLNRFAVRISVAAVHGALVSMALMPVAASAQDVSVADLATPTNTAQLGVIYVDPSNHDSRSGNNTTRSNSNGNNTSYKFGEYNGLEKKGAYGDINIDLRGGGAYDSENATRYRVIGTDLGLETRNLQAEYGQQGSFRLNFGYDELRRNRSDTYQTPYNGAGTNSLTLPSGWLVPTVPRISSTTANARGLSTDVSASNAIVTGASLAPTVANSAASAAIQAADLPAFHNYNVYTKRTKEDVGFGMTLNPNWDVVAGVRHEKKDGTKLMGTVSRMNATTTASDISAVIPDLIDQTTDQYNLALNYKDENSFASVAYYGSIFKNNVKSMSWQDWATGGAVGAGGAPAGTILGTGLLNTMSSAPNNSFHQLNLTGGYDFSKATKLVGNLSYARNTQNDSFISDATDTSVPRSSLNGLVVTKAFNLKLTHKASKDLSFTGAYKYDNRDNRTPVATYMYSDAQEAAVANANFPGVTAQNANANRPYSKKVNQLNLDADYRAAPGHAIKLGYDWQKIDRYCNGTWIDCMDAATTKENTARAEWRANLNDAVNTRLAYAYSSRKVDAYNENAFLALVPYANVVPAGQTISAYQALQLSGLTGYGPISGYNGGVFAGTGLTGAQAALFFPNNNALANAAYANNNRISELPGMRRFNMADRNRDKLRASVNWQATDQFSFQGGVDYNKDDYKNSTYGLKDAKSWVLNLDGTYQANEDTTATVFYTYEDQRSRAAGNSYTANSNTNNVGTFTAISGGCYATILARNNANKIDPCLNWTNDMRDKVDTLGLSLRQKNLMAGKLDLAADLTFTRAKSDNNATGGNYVNNPLAVAGAPAGTIAAFFIPASALPTVTTDTVQLTVKGKYTIDKTSAVQVGYTYARMKASDYAYDGMNLAGLSGVLPSMEQAPNYTVHVIGAAYIYSFK